MPDEQLFKSTADKRLLHKASILDFKMHFNAYIWFLLSALTPKIQVKTVWHRSRVFIFHSVTTPPS